VKADTDSHYVVLDTQRRLDRRPSEGFDRLAFALRALSILCPAGMRVALYSRGSDFRVEKGRELGAGDDASWALVGIPHDASRESIALALAELAGFERAPYVVDLIASATTSASS
jgi:hypothetical protein